MKANQRKKWDAAKVGVMVGLAAGVFAAYGQFERLQARGGGGGPAWDILLGYFILNFLFWGALAAAICWARNRLYAPKQ